MSAPTGKASLAVTATYALLRVFSALFFMQAGGMKLFHWFGGMPGGATAALGTQVWWAGMLEVFGGTLLLLGLGTRPVAFILSGEMAVAYWQFHAPHGGIWPVQNNGMAAALLAFLFLFMAAYGGGDWSVDAMIRRMRGPRAAAPLTVSPGAR